MDMTTEPVRLPNGDVENFVIRLCGTLFKFVRQQSRVPGL